MGPLKSFRNWSAHRLGLLDVTMNKNHCALQARPRKHTEKHQPGNKSLTVTPCREQPSITQINSGNAGNIYLKTKNYCPSHSFLPQNYNYSGSLRYAVRTPACRKQEVLGALLWRHSSDSTIALTSAKKCLRAGLINIIAIKMYVSIKTKTSKTYGVLLWWVVAEMFSFKLRPIPRRTNLLMSMRSQKSESKHVTISLECQN